MNCRNCGAAMELFERRRYYFCAYCGTFDFIETSPQDGVEILERSHGAPCPVCAAPLAKALLDNVHPISYCERCTGMLVPRGSFVDVITSRRAAANGPTVTPAPLDPRELQRRIACPTCHERMDVHPYYGPGNILIDTCSRCDVIWLDNGELKQVGDAPGRDRG
jgi:Zn-finger nucleic acid-binding protein